MESEYGSFFLANYQRLPLPEAPGVTADIGIWHHLQESEEPETLSECCMVGDSGKDCRCTQKSQQEAHGQSMVSREASPPRGDASPRRAHTDNLEQSLASSGKVALASQPHPVSKGRRDRAGSCNVEELPDTSKSEIEDASLLERAEAYGKTFTDAFKWQVNNEEAGTINLQKSMGISRSLTPHRTGSGASAMSSPGSGPRRAMTPGSTGRSERTRFSGEPPRVGLSTQQTPQRLPTISRQPSPAGSPYALPPAPPYQAPVMLLALGEQYELSIEAPRSARARDEPSADGFVEIDSEIVCCKAVDTIDSEKAIELEGEISEESADGYFKVADAHSGSSAPPAPQVKTSAGSTSSHISRLAEASAAKPYHSTSSPPNHGDTASSNTRDFIDIPRSGTSAEASEEKTTPAHPCRSDEGSELPAAGSFSVPAGDLDSASQPMETPQQKLLEHSVRTPRSPPDISPRELQPQSPSTRSLSSSDSTLPDEFSDIDEPPTQAIATGAERALFEDTNEIPIQLPQMGTRTCVTQYRYADAKRELSLGLRGMNCLAPNGSATSVVQVSTYSGWIYQPDSLESQLAPIQDTPTPIMTSRPAERDSTARTRKSHLRDRVHTPRRRSSIPVSPREEDLALVPNEGCARGPGEPEVNGDSPESFLKVSSSVTLAETLAHQNLEEHACPERSPSVLSVSSSEISLPPEFPEDQDGGLAVEHEIAAFSNTHEVPMELPKMGRRKCVTQWIKSNSQREVSLGLRAMSTLDSNNGMSGV